MATIASPLEVGGPPYPVSDGKGPSPFFSVLMENVQCGLSGKVRQLAALISEVPDPDVLFLTETGRLPADFRAHPSYLSAFSPCRSRR